MEDKVLTGYMLAVEQHIMRFEADTYARTLLKFARNQVGRGRVEEEARALGTKDEEIIGLLDEIERQERMAV